MTLRYDHSPQAQRQQAEYILAAINGELRSDDSRLYLLVDPLSLPDDSSDPLVNVLQALQPLAVKLPHDSLAADSYLWLLPLDLQDKQQAALLTLSVDHALQELHPQRLEQGEGRAICGWLTSSFDATTVARQLGETAIQRLPDNSSILLRYYDPAVHSILWSSFNVLQRQRWMGVLSSWIYPCADGQLIIRRHKATPTPQFTFSLMISHADNALITQIGKINRALEQYRLQCLLLERYKERRAIEIAKAALQRACSLHQFSEEHDQQALALDCLQWHPQLDMHPDIRILLSAEERPANSSYVKCVAQLNDSLRQKMCDDMAVLAINTSCSPTY